MGNHIEDPELDHVIAAVRSLIAKSRNGLRRRRLGRLFGEIAGSSLAAGIPRETLTDQLVEIMYGR